MRSILFVVVACMAGVTSVAAQVADVAWVVENYQEFRDTYIQGVTETSNGEVVLLGEEVVDQDWNPWIGLYDDYDGFWHRFRASGRPTDMRGHLGSPPLDFGAPAPGSDLYLLDNYHVSDDYSYDGLYLTRLQPSGLPVWNETWALWSDAHPQNSGPFTAAGLVQHPQGVAMAGIRFVEIWNDDFQWFDSYVSFFLLLLSPTGEELTFVHFYPHVVSAICHDLVALPNGDVIIAGRGAAGVGNPVQGVLIRSSAAGDVLWTSTLPGVFEVTQVATLPDGNLVAVVRGGPPRVLILDNTDGTVLAGMEVNDIDAPCGLWVSQTGRPHVIGPVNDGVAIAALDVPAGEILAVRQIPLPGEFAVNGAYPTADGGLLLAGDRKDPGFRNARVGWMARLTGITPRLSSSTDFLPAEGGTVDGLLSLQGGDIVPSSVVARLIVEAPDGSRDEQVLGSADVQPWQLGTPYPWSVSIPSSGPSGTWHIQATLSPPGEPDVVLNEADLTVHKAVLVTVQEPFSSPSGPVSRFMLHPASPNPFNASTTVGVDIPTQSPLTVTVYDLLGRPVRVLHDGPAAPGPHRFVFDARGLATGTYLLRAETEDEKQMRRMLFLK